MKFNPSYYVPRAGAENAFTEFMEGKKRAFVVIGSPGCGKTYLFCHFAREYWEHGFLVLFYDSITLSRLEIEKCILEDLGLVIRKGDLSLYPDFRETMKEVSKLATIEHSKTLILIDAVDQSDNYAVLLRSVFEMIEKIDFPNIKVAFNSRTDPWKSANERFGLLEKSETYHLENLEDFSNEELKKAYTAYMRHFNLKSEFDDISPKIKQLIKRPMMLEAISSIYADQQIPKEAAIPPRLNSLYEELDHRNDIILALQTDIEKAQTKLKAIKRKESGRFCALTSGVCSTVRKEEPNSCFIGFPYSPYFDEIVDSVIKPVLSQFNIKPRMTKEEYYGGNLLCKICQIAQSSSFGIMDISNLNPNVVLELGLVLGIGKKVILTASKVYKGETRIPSDLQGFYRIEYETHEELTSKLKQALEKYIVESPRAGQQMKAMRTSLSCLAKKGKHEEAEARMAVMETGTAGPKISIPERVPTGCVDLDKLLHGGIPSNYAVILTSPSCDERNLLIRGFLETGAKQGEVTFYVTIDPLFTKPLAEKSPSNFYLFVCNPQADALVKSKSNVFKLKGVENLTEISTALTSTIRKLDPSLKGPRRICIDIISDVLLQHHAVQTRRWLASLITEFKSMNFTTLAVIDTMMHHPEEVRVILELFDGEINIYEKEAEEGPRRYLKIQKLGNQKYENTHCIISEFTDK